MENVLDTVALAMLLIMSLVLFVILMVTLIPRFFLRVRYDLERGLGRGIKKYKYPSGRAVVYEPHPVIRKYINRYILFTNDGYKYLRCLVDAGVRSLDFELIMLNNKNKVIDSVKVLADIGGSSQSGDILLHPDTSYVAINLIRANGIDVKKLVKGYFTAAQLGIYFGVMALISFVELLFASEALGRLLALILEKKVFLGASGFYFIASVMISVIAVALVLINFGRKGIGVVLHDKK